MVPPGIHSEPCPVALFIWESRSDGPSPRVLSFCDARWRIVGVLADHALKTANILNCLGHLHAKFVEQMHNRLVSYSVSVLSGALLVWRRRVVFCFSPNISPLPDSEGGVLVFLDSVGAKDESLGLRKSGPKQKRGRGSVSKSVRSGFAFV